MALNIMGKTSGPDALGHQAHLGSNPVSPTTNNGALDQSPDLVKPGSPPPLPEDPSATITRARLPQDGEGSPEP